MVDASLAGALLVAAPTLDDPNFARSVVLLLDHDDEGALGVVLNRPSDVATRDAVPLPGMPGWADVLSEPAVVHVGGPVTPDAVVCLGRIRRHGKGGPGSAAARALPGWTPLAGVIGAVDLENEPVDLLDALDGLRVFAGYAGWGPGQLDAELERDDWILEPATLPDAFANEPRDLWQTVLTRKGGSYALVARMPADPSSN